MKLIILILFISSCAVDQSSENTNDINEENNLNFDIPSIGSLETLDLVTWNIEFFPKNNQTVSYLKVN